MLHEGVENGVSVTSLILRCEGQLHFCPLLWSPRAPSLPCSLSSLPEWAWEDLVAMDSCLIFPWSHLTPPHLPAFSPLLPLPPQPGSASPGRTSKSWMRSLRILCLVLLAFPGWYIWRSPPANAALSLLGQFQTRQTQPHWGVGSPTNFALWHPTFAAGFHVIHLVDN